MKRIARLRGCARSAFSRRLTLPLSERERECSCHCVGIVTPQWQRHRDEAQTSGRGLTPAFASARVRTLQQRRRTLQQRRRTLQHASARCSNAAARCGNAAARCSNAPDGSLAPPLASKTALAVAGLKVYARRRMASSVPPRGGRRPPVGSESQPRRVP